MRHFGIIADRLIDTVRTPEVRFFGIHNRHSPNRLRGDFTRGCSGFLTFLAIGILSALHHVHPAKHK